MRNFVECCLGGEAVLPEMTIIRRQPLEDGDVLLVCTDGVWSNLKDAEIAGLWRRRQRQLPRLRSRRWPRRRWRHRRRTATMPRLPASSGATDRNPEQAMRPSGRAADELRPVRFTRGFTAHAEGSVLGEFGGTRVLCTASVENGVPPFLRNSGKGWLTAEYGMLPRATHTRTAREAARGKQGGRTQEIQRLIGRSLRACIDLGAIGERTITIDCDVLQADGGTRTAAITGGFVALADAIDTLIERGQLDREPAARPGRRGLGRHRRGRRRARPRLRRGRRRGDRHERRDEFRRRLHRGAGHGRGPCLPARGTRRDADLAAGGIAQLFGLQREARQG